MGKTLLDLKNALEALAVSDQQLADCLQVTTNAIGVKYMAEMYQTVPKEDVARVQTMSQEDATQALHAAYKAQTGIDATDRLDQIIDAVVSGILERPKEYFGLV